MPKLSVLFLAMFAAVAAAGELPVQPSRDAAATALPDPAAAKPEAAAWGDLGDPELARLVAQALAANADLRVASARLRAAWAQAGLVRTGALPEGGLSLARAGGEPAPPDWQADVAFSWELDLTRRLARQREAARARIAAQAAETRALQQAIAASVARTWFELLGAREAIALRTRFLQAQAQLVELVQVRVEAGAAAPGDLARARAEAAADGAALQEAREAAAVLEARLAALLGETPGRWQAPPAAPLERLHLKPLALPPASALLAARPDVQAAAHALHASEADARAARAARWPRLNLVGVLGFFAGDAGSLFERTQARSHGAALDWPLLSLPRLQAEVAVADAAGDSARAERERVVLAALEDVEVALRRHAGASERAWLWLEAASQAHRAAAAVEAAHAEGSASLLDALLARRDALRNELAATAALVGQRTAVVDVLRALAVPPAAAAG